MMKILTLLKVATTAAVCAVLLACGGGGGGSDAVNPPSPPTGTNPTGTSPTVTETMPSVPSTVPGVTGTTPAPVPLPTLPENQPWKSLFAPGVDKLTLRSVSCISSFNINSNPAVSTSTLAINPTVTLSLGSTTMSIKVAAHSVTFPGLMLLGDSTDSNYNVSLPSGTNTIVKQIGANATVGAEVRRFVVRVSSDNSTKQDLIYTYNDGVATTSLVCRAGLINSITTNSVNINPAERVKLLMQNSKDAEVTSAAAGCPTISGRSIFSYSVNKNGEIKFNGVLLPVDWLNGATNINSLYEEFSSFEPSGASNAFIRLHNNKFEGFGLSSNIGRDSSFSHRCYP